MRDLTAKSSARWHQRDIDGDELIVYTPEVGVCGVGGVASGKATGFAVLLDAARLDALIAELQDRRARMPIGGGPGGFGSPGGA